MKRTSLLKKMGVVAGAALGLCTLQVQRASACGCFTPPDPSVPVVQAGERIAFAMEGGEVTAHIQIQYAGNAGEFGWILPLPSVPKLELGTDELFAQLTSQTQPKYRLQRQYEGNCSFDPSRSSGGFGQGSAAPTDAASAGGDAEDKGSPLVIQDSVGPYDYAVLKADSKDEMLKWLSDNRYFVPAGTDGAVGPYIRPGAFFLALKLRSGSSEGDLQPVVLRYQSDLPMIPIVLTSVAAQPDMGVQVWMLGKGRAIPRNYYHTVINDAQLDWLNGAQNYNEVIIAATKEAPERHTFVTEYAGTSSVLKDLLNAPGRFGDVATLASMPDEIQFVNYLRQHNYPFTSQLTSILGRYIPLPKALADKGITLGDFYGSLSYYLGNYRQQNPQDFVGYTVNYQPTLMAGEINERVIQPTLQAGALFDQYPYLTRLYTTLSPEDMNKDPVFSFNATLASWPNVHEGTLTYHCGFFGGGNQSETPATLRTAAGWVIEYPEGTGNTGGDFSPLPVPASERIEVLAEEGPPQVLTDNSGTIGNKLGGASGCSVEVGGQTSRAAGGLFGLGLLAALALSRRLVRRRQQG